jgi:hypothetical protein
LATYLIFLFCRVANVSSRRTSRGNESSRGDRRCGLQVAGSVVTRVAQWSAARPLDRHGPRG